MSQNSREKRFRLLLEGPKDEYFVQHLCNAHAIPRGSFAYVRSEGFPAILEDLAAGLKASETEMIGMAIDADQDTGSRWQSVRDHLVKLGFRNVPSTPGADGTLVAGADDLPVYLGKRVAVWLMPDNTTQGMLEDFVFSLIPPDDDLWTMAANAVAQIEPAKRRFGRTYSRKAEIHTWLAWQEYPGSSLGMAVTRRYFNSQHSAALSFIRWLRAIFEIPEAG